MLSLVYEDGGEATRLIRATGIRHIKYGIPPEHLPSVGPALCLTFGEFLEGYWNDEQARAWTTVFDEYIAVSLFLHVRFFAFDGQWRNAETTFAASLRATFRPARQVWHFRPPPSNVYPPPISGTKMTVLPAIILSICSFMNASISACDCALHRTYCLPFSRGGSIVVSIARPDVSRQRERETGGEFE